MFIKAQDEKRETARLIFNSTVSILDDQQNEITGTLRDLSATGVSIQTESRLHAGSDCNLSITIAGDNSKLKINKLSAKVIRFHKNIVALEFKDKMEWLTLFYVYKNKLNLTKS